MTTADLTRWNRAGLDQLTYVDGNAVTYLETLRAALAAAFAAWSALQVDAGEPAQVTQERVLSQYQAPVGDYGWELARTFARCGHVLSGYLDAYANAGYLATATDWDDVRKLVAMLDYVPAPPASASTVIAIDAALGISQTVLSRGYQMSYTPPQGTAVIFETLADLELDSTLNALAVAPPPGPTLNGSDTVTVPGQVRPLLIGDPVILSEGGQIEVYPIVGIEQSPDATTLTIGQPISQGFDTNAAVLLQPRKRVGLLGPVSDHPSQLRQAGAQWYEINLTFEVAQLAAPPKPGDPIVISDLEERDYYGIVTAVGGTTVTVGPIGTTSLQTGPIRLDQATATPPVTVSLDQATYTSPSLNLLGNWTYLTGRTVLTDSGPLVVTTAAYLNTTDSATTQRTQLTFGSTPGTSVPATTPGSLQVPPPGAGQWKLDAPLAAPGPGDALPDTITVSGAVNAISGDFVVVASANAMTVGQIAPTAPAGPTTTINLTSPLAAPGQPLYCAQTTLYTGFATELNPVLLSQPQPLSGKSIPLAQLPPALLPGGQVVVERTDDATLSMTTTVDAIDAGSATITLADPLPADSTNANVVIHANAVTAGHGQSQPQRVLGSGDATQTGQTFILAIAGVAFTADPTAPNGLVAAVAVQLGQQIWQQVSDLSTAAPTDPSYTASVTETGELQFQFGDGIHGRRLPTGTNNVLVTYRVGIGEAGNLPAFSLQPARPNPLIADATQLLPAAGGGAMEPIESLRDNAPASLLALDRAVSLDDYTTLAQRQPTVQDAVAIAQTPAGRSQQVTVAVIPTAGTAFDSIQGPLAAYLTDQAPPGVNVSVQSYTFRPLLIGASIGVNTSLYVFDLVAERAQMALISNFSLSARRLGQPIYESDVIGLLESIPAILYASCTLRMLLVDPPELAETNLSEVVRPPGRPVPLPPRTAEYFLADLTEVIALSSPQAATVSEATS